MDASSSSSKYQSPPPAGGSGSSRVFLVSDSNQLCVCGNVSSSLPSEEAKSTTWLHPVSGEAVITGHRKTPGEGSPNKFPPSSPPCRHVRLLLLLLLPASWTRHFPQCVRERDSHIHAGVRTHEWAFGAVQLSEPCHAPRSARLPSPSPRSDKSHTDRWCATFTDTIHLRSVVVRQVLFYLSRYLLAYTATAAPHWGVRVNATAIHLLN